MRARGLLWGLLPFALWGLVSLTGTQGRGLLPATWSLRSWEALGRQAGSLVAALGGTALTALATVALVLVVAWPAARFLSRKTGSPWTLLGGFLMLPAFIPVLTWLGGLQRAVIVLGLRDSFPGVVLGLALVTYPYMLAALLTGYGALDPRQPEIARMLGASRTRAFITVELPLLVPALASGGSVVFLAAWTDWLLVFVLGGGRVPSYPGILFPYLLSGDRSLGAALLLVHLALPLLVLGPALGYLVRRSRLLGSYKGGFHV